jgi:hypothetical protein
MTDSIELPVLTQLSHMRRSPSRVSDVVTSATMGYGASALGHIEAQTADDIATVNSRESGDSDPLLLRGKIVPEDELEQIRK